MPSGGSFVLLWYQSATRVEHRSRHPSTDRAAVLVMEVHMRQFTRAHLVVLVCGLALALTTVAGVVVFIAWQVVAGILPAVG